MSQNPHLGDTFNLLQWQWQIPPLSKPNTKLFYSIYWGAQSDPNCYFHNAIQLKRSSASRSVNLQTNRTKTWQFKFTRNQGFTQDPNSEEMRRQWKAADNARTMRQTPRSRPNTRQRPKESHLAATMQTRVLLTQGSLGFIQILLSILHCYKEERFTAKPPIETSQLQLLLVFEVLKSI